MSIVQNQLPPRDLAVKEGKTVICRVMGPMVGVYYPYRKSGDLYVIGPGDVAHCCQGGCDKDFPTKDFLEHVRYHNKMKTKYPSVIIDPSLVKQEIPER